MPHYVTTKRAFQSGVGTGAFCAGAIVFMIMFLLSMVWLDKSADRCVENGGYRYTQTDGQ